MLTASTAFTAHYALTLIAWVLSAALIWILMLIARYFQRLSGQQTHARLLAIPILCFGLAALRTISINSPADPLADVFGCVGGLSLIGLTLSIYYTMMRRH